jgi:cardiolipin synthase
MVSKLNTVTQIVLVLAVLLSQVVAGVPYLWMDVLLYCVLVTTLWSGFDYVWRWSRRAWRKGAH